MIFELGSAVCECACSFLAKTTMDWKEPIVLMLENSDGALDHKGVEMKQEMTVDVKQEVIEEHAHADGVWSTQTKEEVRDEYVENKIKVEDDVLNLIVQSSAQSGNLPEKDIEAANAKIKEEIIDAEVKQDESGSTKTENIKIEEIYVEEEMKEDDEDDTAGDVDPLADDMPVECQEVQVIIDNQDAEFGENIGNSIEESHTKEPGNSQHQIANSYLNGLGGKQNNEFICYICNIRTPIELSLLQHLKSHVDGELYKCLRCTYKTGNTKTLIGHMSIHNPSKVYKCDICCYCTDFPTSLRLHKKYSHSNRIRHVCKLCDYRTNSQKYYKLHFLLHITQMTYTCKMCNYRSLRRINIKAHTSMHAGERTHPCPSCSYRAYHSTDLRMHLQTHGQFGQFNCNHCNLGFGSKRGLRQHLRTHKGNI